MPVAIMPVPYKTSMILESKGLWHNLLGRATHGKSIAHNQSKDPLCTHKWMNVAADYPTFCRLHRMPKVG